MGFELSAAAQAKLAERRQRYTASLRDKHANIKEFAKPVQQGELSGLALEPLREAVHKLAGSAGLYGFAKLQEAAAALDLALMRGADAQGDIAKQLDGLFGAFAAVLDD